MERKAAKTETTDCQNAKPPGNTAAPFIFDLIGPIVVYFQEGTNGAAGTANICAPLCDSHFANILTDSDDVSLHGWPSLMPSGDKPFIYDFGATAPTGQPKFACDSPEKLLIVANWPSPIDPANCHLVFVAPCPDKIVPLYGTEAIWIHQGDANTWVTRPDKDKDGNPIVVNQPRGRGLRFVYQACPKMPIINVQSAGSPDAHTPQDFGDICAKTMGFPNSPVTPHYRMTLRFAAFGAKPDEHHEDAYECFQAMRSQQTLGSGSDLYKWRADFDDTLAMTKAQLNANHPSRGSSGLSLLQHTGANPRDCGAAVVVLQDWADTSVAYPVTKR